MTVRIRPKLITTDGSLNLFAHPVREIRQIANDVGAKVIFDAAHQCGMIAGRAWANPLQEGAHVMTMSTYKSLGGPPSGLIVTNESDIAERLDKIAFPGMTANFDAAKSAALAISMLGWRDHGKIYARKMIAAARALATALTDQGIALFTPPADATSLHHFAIQAAAFNGGQSA